MTELDCLLKAENFATAARLEPTELAAEYVWAAAFWRIQAMKLGMLRRSLPATQGAARPHVPPQAPKAA